MFDDTRLRGTEFDSAYIELRRQWEPVTEVTQLKATRKHTRTCHLTMSSPTLKPSRTTCRSTRAPTRPKPGDYMRTALMRGLALEHSLAPTPTSSA